MARRAPGRRPARATRTARGSRYAWASLPDEELLDLRLKDLGLSLEGTALEARVERLQDELGRAGMRFRPYVWLSTDWFTPDGLTGFAVPFFLAHPRLMRLERRHMLEVEGASQSECLRLLRHETGHALDNAYGLRRRKRFREVFGRSSEPYRASYVPRPHSRRYVRNLDQWYAQSHPLEDFAETFAVWLRPGARWRARYAGWPALRKLEFVDELMGEIAAERPRVRTRERAETLRSLDTTLRQYWQRKRAHYSAVDLSVYDRDLRRLFSGGAAGRGRPSAAAFLRRHRRALRRHVARWTGQYQYVVDQVLQEMIQRCRELDLRLSHGADEARLDAVALLTAQTIHYVQSGHREYWR